VPFFFQTDRLRHEAAPLLAFRVPGGFGSSAPKVSASGRMIGRPNAPHSIKQAAGIETPA
jgi:hypothetical protein